MKQFIYPVLFLLCSNSIVSASIVLTQDFETPENTDWSLNLGANTTGGQITDGTASKGNSHLRVEMGQNEFDGGGTLTDSASMAVFGQGIWSENVRLDEISTTMDVRGDVSSYIVYQVVPDPTDLSNQFFIVGGELQGSLSTTSWTQFSAGQDDAFHVADYLGNRFRNPGYGPGSTIALSALVSESILLDSDGSDSGLTWGDARVRWVTPTAGYAGGIGYDPAVSSELDNLEVSAIPEPSAVGIWLGAIILACMIRRRRAEPIQSN